MLNCDLSIRIGQIHFVELRYDFLVLYLANNRLEERMALIYTRNKRVAKSTNMHYQFKKKVLLAESKLLETNLLNTLTLSLSITLTPLNIVKLCEALMICVIKLSA